MGVYSGPEIVKDGLVLHLDAATNKSFRGEPTVNLFSTFSSNPDNAILLGVSPISSACGFGVGANWSRCNYGGGAYTYNHIETKNPYGNQSLVGNLISITTGGDYRSNISDIGSSTLNRTFTFSMWIKNNGGTVSTIQMSIRTNGDANGPSASKTITSEWQRISITHTFTGTCTAQVRCYLFGLNAGANLLFYGAQLEEQAYPTPFVNGTRGTTVATGGGWADLSGNTNHGELVNGPTFNSDNLGSLVFDGVDDSCTLPNVSFFSPQFSFGFVLNYNSSQSVQFPRILAGSVEQELESIGYFVVFRWGGSTTFSANNFIIPNSINYYFITYSSPSLLFYRNGILFDTKSFSSSGTTSYNSLMNRSDLTRPLNGGLYSALLYSRALTPQEVRQNFYATRGRYGV
jgi:hypothetical protein